MGALPQIGVVGSGMIVEDQNGPAIAQLVCRGVLGQVHVAAQGSASLRKLLGLPWWNERFPELPEGWVTTYPSRETDPAVRRPDFYRDMYRALPRGSVVVIAVPDASHEALIVEALEAGLHVVTVKSLCTSYAGTQRIRDLARERGLFVGIDFHKRWDYRALLARDHWRAGHFGTPRAARATMIEADVYIRAGSPFDRHFVPETSDPATYVGCHYVDQFGWFTGLKPEQVVVSGILGRFESGTPCYSWAATQLTYDRCVLQLINGLQHAGDHRGRNHQGLEIWGESPHDFRGTYFCHQDNLRGMDYVYRRDQNPGRPTDAGSDYVGFIPRSDGVPGKEMVGYGWRAIEALIKAAIRVEGADDLRSRQALLTEIDDAGLIPTPANTAYLGLVYEAMRKSIRGQGLAVAIDYERGETNYRTAPL
ncbi:MAG: Gfo/Idh/MocA family oxidoreductase [Isosphaeraceae bacterium]|nr:Gfo/Idh/MocA family oxidoreductase [Isosphaeraceae bacterium]